MQKEIWKDIPGYEGYYQVSDLGRVKGLDRIVDSTGRKSYLVKGRVLSPRNNGLGYSSVALNKNGKRSNYSAHQLVAIAFLNHKPCGFQVVVDHIDNNSLNNKLDNLQLISFRENTSKDRVNGSSIYTGVHWCNRQCRWVSKMQINGKSKYLGSYKCELEAAKAYINKLNELTNELTDKLESHG